MNRRILTISLLGALAAPWSVHAQQSFPDKPIQIVVASAAGGASDIVARLLRTCF